MDAATTSIPTPSSGNADEADSSPHRERDELLRSPDRLPRAVVAQRWIMRAGAVGSPVRRSPRLSRLPPQQTPVQPQDTPDRDGSSGDDSESVNDVALQLSREDTPVNDAFPPDEPSTILASRIIRAHGNPSPPPLDTAHPGINYVPGKDGPFPPPDVYAPPSSFRPINLLERLDQPSHPSFDPSWAPRNSTLGDRTELPVFDPIPPCGPISPQSCLPFVRAMPTKDTPHEDLASADAIPSSSARCMIDDPPSQSSGHVCDPAMLVDNAKFDPPAHSVAELRGQLINPTSSPDSKAFISSSAQAVSSSSNLVKLLAQDTEAKFPGAQGDAGKETLTVDSNRVSVFQEKQERKCRTTTARVDANPHQRLNSLSSDSTNLLAGLCMASEPTTPIEKSTLPAESLCSKHQPATPPQTPKPFIVHPDFSGSTVQRPPIVAPTPMRANDTVRKLYSPLKFSSEADDTRRTPAQRVPVETVFARGTSSFQKTLPPRSDQSQSGHLLTIRGPVFSRPVLGDPFRTPAKRVPVMDLVASPTRGDQAQGSPMRFSLRARSASVEPRPVRPVPARSRSVEPSGMISQPDHHGKTKGSVFPAVTMLPRSGAKLPFPLVTSQKTSNNLPPPIPEEHENAERPDAETDATPGRVAQGNTASQLRQPSSSSRIPRIGNKPYARPLLKSGKIMAPTTTVNVTRVPRVPPYQTAGKGNRVWNSNADTASTQSTNDRRPVGSLKRKRGAEATTPSTSQPVMIRQVVPGILSEKYAPKPAKPYSQVQVLSESSSPKAPQPLKFRKVVDGMLSARYVPVKANPAQTESSDPQPPLSPLSELSSSSNEEPSDEKPSTTHPSARPKNETSGASRTDGDVPVVESNTQEHSSSYQHAGSDEASSRLRRTSRARKPAQQQYVLDVFNSTTSTRPPPARRKPQTRMDGDGFMGMSATALKALTTSNTTKNQQTVAVLATEVIRKEGTRPESPTVKARTILQKQRDERDKRRRERAERKVRMGEVDLGASDTEGQAELDDWVSPGTYAVRNESDDAMPEKHRRGPGEEENYETPQRPERTLEPLRLEGVDREVKPGKQVKWHRGLSTAVYLDQVDPKPRSLPKGFVVVRGCLAPTSKNLPLDPLGNLLDINNRPSPELVSEQVVVKKYLYDNDVEPEPIIPAKTTRSKTKKTKS